MTLQLFGPGAIELLEARVHLSANQGNHKRIDDMVLHWNEITVDVLRADQTLPGPGWSSRNMAIESIAIFDAVNAIDKSYTPYASQPKGYEKSNTSMDAAIATAAHDALVALYPQQAATIDAEWDDSLKRSHDPAKKEARGIELGHLTAKAILDLRADDGSSDITPYTVDPSAGHWQPDPVNPSQLAWGPGWGKVTPFALSSGNQFRAEAPPAMNSAAYADAFNEVKSLGEKNSATRTAEQTEIGLFWAYDRAGTGTPPALYCQAVETICQAAGTSLVENARLFALVNIAQADAGISAWETKFTYDLWRPVTAIRRGAEDNNPATLADPTWEPLGAPGGGVVTNFTPPFPAYVSGHATFGAAVFRVLADFHGTDEMRFKLTSDELPGVTRTFNRFSQAADENARSRIYLGIHWNFDATQGESMGRQVADWGFNHVLTPIDNGDHHQGGGSNFSVRPVHNDTPAPLAVRITSLVLEDKSDAERDDRLAAL